MDKQHDIVFLSYNSVAKTCWFYLDGIRRLLTGIESREDCGQAIVDFVAQIDAQEEPSGIKTYSKLRLCLALADIGKLDAFKAWLAASGYEFLWNAAQDLASDNAMFAAGVEAVKSALALTDAEADDVLAAAEITEG